MQRCFRHLPRTGLRAGGLVLLAAVSAAVFAAEPALPARLGSNENAFGYTPRALERMKEALASGSYYNGNEVTRMIELCAELEQVPTEFILPTPGSGPVLLMAAAAYARPGANVVTTAMGYTQLTRAFAEHGGDVKFAPLGSDMGYDFDALRATIDVHTVLVYLCNPNNPTGVLADPARLRDFVVSVPEHILVFVDEAYLELADTGLAANTMVALTKERPNVLVSRTFSKGYGMAGLRAGYGIAPPAVLAKLRRFYLGGPSYLAAIAAQEAILDRAHLEHNRTQYREVRDYVCREFDRLGITYASPQGAFIYFRSGMRHTDLVARMRQSQILISGSRESGVPPGTYGDWARVSIGTKEEMELFLGELTRILGKT
jgi:histidinol-phosphate aminotransferase